MAQPVRRVNRTQQGRANQAPQRPANGKRQSSKRESPNAVVPFNNHTNLQHQQDQQLQSFVNGGFNGTNDPVVLQNMQNVMNNMFGGMMSKPLLYLVP